MVGTRKLESPIEPDGSEAHGNQANGSAPAGSPALSEAPLKAVVDREAHRFGKPPTDLPAFLPGPATRVEREGREVRAKRTGDVRIETLDLAKRKDRARFVDMADGIYRGDPHYVAPLRLHLMSFLNPAKNPAFENLDVRPIIAVRDGKVVARIIAHVDRAYNAYHDTQAGFFGFFESIDDRSIAHAVLHEAAQWLKDRGCREVFGPMNLTSNHQMGMIVENFDRPAFIEEPYNPSYYPALFESFGFGKAKDLFVWWIDIAEGMTTEKRQRIKRIAERIRKKENITVRQADPARLKEEIEKLFKIYVGAWEKNWGFVPLSRREFEYLVEPMKDIMIPEMVLFVEVAGEPVGFCATLPNIHEKLPKDGRLLPFGWLKLLRGLKKTKHMRLYTLGMLPAYRKRGLESIMFSETLERGQRLGALGGEIGQTLEDNDLINRAIESMEGRLDRRYRIFGMTL
ncbi:MAG: N-acetyltransferase [Deltaproteobacteria bacterium]|nr:N-acetyltransferase [Deltaproteobacteria bacterium]